MAFIHGKNAEVKVGANDISQYLDSAELSIDTDTADTSTFGSDWKTNAIGQSSATLELSGKYDATATTGPIDVLEALRTAAAEVVYYPQGDATGRHSYTGDFILTSLATTSPIGGIVAFSASLVADGAVTKATVA